MSRAIDEKIVEMKFDNKQFKDGASETMSILDKLKKALDDSIGSQSFDNIDRAAGRVNLTGIQNGVEALADRFSMLGIVAMRVIENITDGLMNRVNSAIHTVTDSIVSGGIRRAMNIENAHFQLQGLMDDEKEVQAIMGDAMDSVDGTAYAYDEAAKAASMFAATGLRSGEKMQLALKAIAGVAATTNSDYQSLSQIFTTVSGQGKVMADQLNQLAVRGMNGAAALRDYFNNVTKGEAEATEETMAAIKKMTEGLEVTEADIRGFVKDGKISFDIFSEAMGRTFGDHAKKANETFNGALSNIKAALARVGANFISPLIGQKGPIVNLFNTIRIKINDLNKTLVPLNDWFEKTVLSNVVKLTRYIGHLDIARYTKVFNEETGKWEKKYTEAGQVVQNFYNILESGKNVFDAVASAMRPIKDAFKETFDFKSLNISGFISKIKDFTHNLILTEDQSKKVHDIAKQIFTFVRNAFSEAITFGNNTIVFIKNLISNLDPLLKIVKSIDGLLSDVSNSLLNFAHRINDIFTNLNYSAIFDRFKASIENVSDAISKLIDILRELVFGKEFKGFEGLFGGLEKAFGVFKRIVESFKPVVEQLWKLLTQDPSKVADSLISGTLFVAAGQTFAKAQETIQSLNKSLENVLNITKNVTKPFENALNLVGNASKTLSSLSGVLIQMQQNLKVGVLMEIAKAILMLAAATLMMDTVDSDKLLITLGSIVTLMTALSGVIVVLENVFKGINKVSKLGEKFTKKHPLITALSGFVDSLSGIMDAVKLRLLVGNIMKFSEAVLLLSVAMKIISTMSWENVLKGLVAVGALLYALVELLRSIDGLGGSVQLTKLGIGLMGIAVAINILAVAVRSLGNLDFGTLVKGLGSVFAVLYGFSKFVNSTSTNDSMIDIGAGLMLVAAAIKILETAVRNFGDMNFEELIKGLGSVFAILLSMGVFLKLGGSATHMISTGAGLAIIAAAIRLLVDPLKEFASFSWQDLIKSIIMFDVVLGEMIMLAKSLPKDTLIRAAGMVALAESIKMLTEPLLSFGEMPFEDALQSVVMLGMILELITSALQEKMPNPAKLLARVVAMIGVAESIKILAEPIRSLGAMPFEDALQSVIVLGVVLKELTWAIDKLPDNIKQLLAKVVSMIALSLSVKILADAFIELGGLSLEGAVAGVVALGGGMFIMCTTLKSLQAMDTAGLLISVLSLVGVAAALKLIAPAFVMLGNMNWDQIGRACAAMASAFGILIAAFGIAGALAEVVGVGAAIIVGSLLGFALVLGVIASVITSAITGLTTGINAIVTSLKELLGVDEDAFGKSCDMIGKALTTIGESLKSFGLLAPIGASALRTASEGLAVLTPALADFAAVADNGKMDLSFVFMRITDAFKYMAEGLKEFNVLDFVRAEALKDVAEGIKILAPAMALIVQLDSTKFNSAMITIGNAFIKFGEAIDKTPFWGAHMRAEGIKTLVEGIGMLATGLPPIMEMDSTLFNATLISIANGFVKFAEAIAKTPFWGAETRAEGIKTLIEGIDLLADNIPKFIQTVDSNTFLPTMTMLGRGFTEFGKALDHAPFWDSKGKGEGIVALVDSIGTLARGVQTFNNIVNANLFESTMTMLGKGFEKLGQSLSAAPLFNAKDRGEGIAIVVDSIKNLANGLKKFSEIEGMNIESTLDSLGTAIFNFGQAIGDTGGIFGIGVDKKAGAIATVINTLSDLVPPIQDLCKLEYQDVKNILFSLGYSLNQYASSINGVDWFTAETKSEAINTVIESVGKLVPTLQTLCRLEYDKLKQVLFSLGYSLQQFVSAVNGLSWSSDDKADTMDQIIESIVKFGKINFTSLNNVISSMDKFINLLSKLNNLNLKDKNDFIKGFADIAEEATKKFESKFKEAIPRVQDTVTDFINALLDKFEDKDSEFKKWGTTNSNSYLEGFQKNNDLAYKFGETFVNRILKGFETVQFDKVGWNTSKMYVEGLESNIPAIEEAGAKTSDGYNQGLESNLSLINDTGSNTSISYVEGLDSNAELVYDAGDTAAKTYSEGLESSIETIQATGEESSQSYKTGLDNTLGEIEQSGKDAVGSYIDGLNSDSYMIEDAGKNAGEGFLEGLKSKLASIAEAGASMARSAYYAAKRALEERSPSKKMAEVGSYAGEGFVNGLYKWSKAALQAGEELGTKTTEGITDSIGGIQNGVDLRPVITPVLNLDNLRDEANQIGGILDLSTPIALANNANLSFSGGISQMLDELEASLPDNSNDDIVNAVNNLNTNMMGVMRTLGQLQVVLDTGTMVGELVNPIDQALNRNYVMSERGVR